MNRLPDGERRPGGHRSRGVAQHLARELGRGHCEPDTWRIVRQLELFRVPVVVRRLQLGNMRAEGFGEWTEIYRTEGNEDGT